MNSESGSDIAAPIAEISFSINKLKEKNGPLMLDLMAD